MIIHIPFSVCIFCSLCLADSIAILNRPCTFNSNATIDPASGSSGGDMLGVLGVGGSGPLVIGGRCWVRALSSRRREESFSENVTKRSVVYTITLMKVKYIHFF